MSKSLFVILSLVHACLAQTSWLYNNKITQTYNNFWTGLEKEMNGVYEGLNLMFQFDQEAYRDQIRVKTPDDLLLEKLREQGFQDINQWLDYKNKQQKGKLSLTLSSAITGKFIFNRYIEENHRRNLEAEIQSIKEFTETYDVIDDEGSVPTKITQHQYFCNDTRVTFLDFIKLRQNITFNCEDEPKIVNNTVCFSNYEKCDKIDSRKCIERVPMRCDIMIQTPNTDGFTQEYMEEYGYGEIGKILDTNQMQNIEIYLNCNQGIEERSYAGFNKNYETTVDYHFLKNDTFWMRDYENYIFLPWDPQIKVVMRVRDFKYLADSYDFEIQVTDPDQLIGKKSLNFSMKVEDIPKTAKPGGRMFYQIDIFSKASYVAEHHRSGFLALKDYVEPKRSAYSNYTQMITFQRVLWTFIIVFVIGLGVYLKRRKQYNDLKLLEDH